MARAICTWVATEGVPNRGCTLAMMRGSMPIRPSAKPARVVATAEALAPAMEEFARAMVTAMKPRPQTEVASAGHGSPPSGRNHPAWAG
jgi:hypothetical protein